MFFAIDQCEAVYAHAHGPERGARTQDRYSALLGVGRLHHAPSGSSNVNGAQITPRCAPVKATGATVGKSGRIPNEKTGPFHAWKQSRLFLRLFRRLPTLPRSCPRSTISSRGLNFRVRDGNGCDPSDRATGKLELNRKSRTRKMALLALSKFYGQANGLISTGQLNTLLCLHTQPIYVVVFHESHGEHSSPVGLHA